MGVNMLYDDYPNRAAAVDKLLQYYLEEEFVDLLDNLYPVRENNTGENLIMPQLAPEITSINIHA